MELEAMSDDELLTEAMKQGYNPDYEGTNKKSPKEYLQVAYDHNKVLKERNENLSQQNDELLSQVENLNRQMERVLQFTQEQKQKAVDAAVRKLKADRREAINDGDTELVERIDEQIEQEKKVAKPDNNPILDAWLAQNPWYSRDEELGLEADIIAKQLQDTGRFTATEQDYQKLLNLVSKKTKEKFPDKFKNPRKDDAPDVESARQSSVNGSKKTYADLPPEAKKACDEFVADKIMSREQYIELYEWE